MSNWNSSTSEAISDNDTTFENDHRSTLLQMLLDRVIVFFTHEHKLLAGSKVYFVVGRVARRS